MAGATRLLGLRLAMAGVLATTAFSPAAAIIGGEKPAPRAYPFVVALIEHSAPAGKESEYVFCGGALVAPQWVLTAANCVHVDLRKQGPNEIDLYLGSDDFRNGDRVSAAEIVVHPQYGRVTGENDLALVHLQRPPGAGAKTAVVRLATDPNLEDASSPRGVKAMGWGATDLDGQSGSRDLLAVDLQLRWSATACPLGANALNARWSSIAHALDELRIGTAIQEELYRRAAAASPRLIPSHSLCTAGPDSTPFVSAILRTPNSAKSPPNGPCGADAGGPLIGVEPDGTPVQLGVASFPFGYEQRDCDRDLVPPYYVSVGAYADWIARVISGR